MNLKPASLLLILPVMAACQAETQTDQSGDTGSALIVPPEPEVSSVSYSCESGTEMKVTLDGARTLHLNYDGQTLNLQGEAVNSGASYRNAEYRWAVHRTGDLEQGTLYRGTEAVEVCNRQQVSAAPEPGLAPCRAQQIDLKVGDTDAGMGHRQQTYELTLKGDQPCLLPAWPTVKLEGRGGKPAPALNRTTDSYFGTENVEQRQTLTKERSVMFHVGWSVIPDETKGNDPCPMVGSLSLSAPGGGTLTPPDQVFGACGRGVVLSPFRPLANEDRKTD